MNRRVRLQAGPFVALQFCCSAQVLWDEITIEDPVTLEKPWTLTYAYRKMPDYTLLEYVCEDKREYADEKGVQRIRIGPAAK